MNQLGLEKSLQMVQVGSFLRGCPYLTKLFLNLLDITLSFTIDS